MKFTIKTKVITRYLKMLSGVIPPMVHRPELAGISINVYDNRIVFQTRNDLLDLSIEENDANNISIAQVGSILVKGKTLNEIISKINNKEVEFILVDENILIIKSASIEYELNLMNNSNFEFFNYEMNEDFSCKINQSNFKNLIQKAIFAGNERSSRRILQGVNFSFLDGILQVYATDNIRISVAKTNATSSTNFEKIIPIKVLKEIIKVFDTKEELVINFTDQKFSITSNNIILQSSLIEGKYPNLLRVFPSDFKYELLIGKDEIINLIDKTTILNPNKTSSSLIVKMSVIKETLKFESRELEIGSASISTQAFDFNSNEAFSISFSPKYLLEAIKYIDEELIKIRLISSQEQFVVSGNNKENFKCLILPFRT
ncbi:MAG: DNA polymerase III subunit beta [Mycoplasmataceae bacterium]|nr:DNA polymerase III subunit beta [Mycoplasmataceae bacterium]